MEPTQLTNSQHSIDLCFMLDCTGSMQPYINMTHNTINSIITKVKQEHPKSLINTGIVAYRDIGDALRFETFPFSTSSDKARDFVGGLVAGGGSDAPEDVNGAFQKALFSMDWQSPVRLLVHIADAPCHGKEFHKKGDYYPHGYREDMDWDKIFKGLVEKRVDYLFMKILADTDLMFAKFREFAEKNGSVEFGVNFQQEEIPKLKVPEKGDVSSKGYSTDSYNRSVYSGTKGYDIRGYDRGYYRTSYQRGYGRGDYIVEYERKDGRGEGQGRRDYYKRGYGGRYDASEGTMVGFDKRGYMVEYERKPVSDKEIMDNRIFVEEVFAEKVTAGIKTAIQNRGEY